jgi:enamine deaminase RidA (YjgF/YER057c/UK114 family)
VCLHQNLHPSAVRPLDVEERVQIEAKLEAMRLALPPAMQAPGGIRLPFAWAVVRGNRVIVSGHGPQNPDGSLAQPLGKVGADLTVEQGYAAARLVALSILGTLKRELGDLDRIVAWTRVFGMVNAAPEFTHHPAVINGFSDLILELWGPEAGNHARSAVGMSGLPFQIPVEIEAEVEVR